MRRLSLLVAVVLVNLLLSPGRARACSVAGPTPHMLDASMQASDHVAPTLPASIPVEITSGKSVDGQRVMLGV